MKDDILINTEIDCLSFRWFKPSIHQLKNEKRRVNERLKDQIEYKNSQISKNKKSYFGTLIFIVFILTVKMDELKKFKESDTLFMIIFMGTLTLWWVYDNNKKINRYKRNIDWLHEELNKKEKLISNEEEKLKKCVQQILIKKEGYLKKYGFYIKNKINISNELKKKLKEHVNTTAPYTHDLVKMVANISSIEKKIDKIFKRISEVTDNEYGKRYDKLIDDFELIDDLIDNHKIIGNKTNTMASSIIKEDKIEFFQEFENLKKIIKKNKSTLKY